MMDELFHSVIDKLINHDAKQISPTLFIGCGGTGATLLLHTKARILEKNSPASIRKTRFLVFDTDSPPAPAIDVFGREVRFEENREFHQISNIRIANITPDRYPLICKELNLEDLRAYSIVAGAKQIRRLGRVALFYHINTIAAQIRNALNDISREHRDDKGENLKFLTLVFVTSAAGGTGSSMLLDLAYLARHFASEIGMVPDHMFSIGVVVMPDVFNVPVGNKARIEANTYALLNEISHFATYRNFNVNYGQMLQVQDSRPPFDICTLVDNRNKRGTAVTDLKSLSPIITETLYLYATTGLGTKMRSQVDNIFTDSETKRQRLMTRYANIGSGALVVDVYTLYRLCTHQLVEHLFEGVWHNKHWYQPEELEKVVSTATNDFDFAYLMGQVFTWQMPPELTVKIDGKKNDGVKHLIEKFDKTHTVTLGKIKTEQRGIFIQKSADHAKKVKAQLVICCQQLMRNSAFNGFWAVEDFLARIDNVLNEIGSKSVNPHRDKLKRNQPKLEKQLSETKEAVTQKEKWALVAKQAYYMAIDAYMDAKRQYLNNQADENKLVAIEHLVQQLRDEVSRLRGITLDAMRSMNDFAKRNSTTLKKLHPLPLRLNEVSVVSPRKMYTDFYSDKFPSFLNGTLVSSVKHNAEVRKPLQQLLGSLVQADFPDAFDPTRDFQVALPYGMYVFKFAQQCFESILTTATNKDTLFGTLLTRYHDLHSQRQLTQQLYGMAEPWSNYDSTQAAKLAGDQDRLIIAGLSQFETEQTKAVFSERFHTIIDTTDHFEASAMIIEHGLLVTELKQYAQYESSYYQVELGGNLPSSIAYRDAILEQGVKEMLALLWATGHFGTEKTGNGWKYNGQEVVGESWFDIIRKVLNDSKLHQMFKTDEIATRDIDLTQLREKIRAHVNEWRDHSDAFESEFINILRTKYLTKDM